MNRRLSIGALTAALLASGMLVGVSYGGGGGITQPEVIELTHSSCGEDARCWFHMLKGSEDGNGQVLQGRAPLHDVDGNVVGTFHAWVSSAPGTGSIITGIETLRAGPYTSRGSVTFTGFVPRDGCYFGDKVCTFAVTGGTGACANVRGHVTEEPDPEGLRTTLHLIP